MKQARGTVEQRERERETDRQTGRETQTEGEGAGGSFGSSCLRVVFNIFLGVPFFLYLFLITFFPGQQKKKWNNRRAGGVLYNKNTSRSSITFNDFFVTFVFIGLF